MSYIGTIGLLTCLLLFGTALAAPQEQAAPVIRVGVQATGTFSWVLHAMQHYGLAKRHGFQLHPEILASKSAARLALRGGKVDIMVDDFIGAEIMYAKNVPIHVIYPFSRVTGGVVVAADSEIESIADLEGKRLAAAALNDNSLLVLRILAREKYGFDPQVDSETLAAAPPLMESLLDKGSIDAAFPYWHHIARMVASGDYRELLSGVDMLQQLDLDTNLPLLVLVARDNLPAPEARNFIRALVATTDRMKTDDAIWRDIIDQGLYSLPDPSVFPAVRARWEAGLPSRWTQAEVDGLSRLTEQLIEVAGADILGIGKSRPEVYVTSLAP